MKSKTIKKIKASLLGVVVLNAWAFAANSFVYSMQLGLGGQKETFMDLYSECLVMYNGFGLFALVALWVGPIIGDLLD